MKHNVRNAETEKQKKLFGSKRIIYDFTLIVTNKAFTTVNITYEFNVCSTFEHLLERVLYF